MEDSPFPLVDGVLGVVPSSVQFCDILVCNEDKVLISLIGYWMVSGVKKGPMKCL